jgi:polyisoprenoid-binding protein YceI
MKKIILLASLFACSAAFAYGKEKKAEAAPQAKSVPIKVDPTASLVNWKADKKMTSGHKGTVAIKSGEVIFEKDKLAGGSFKIDMKTIKVTDIPTDSKDNQKLVGHLNSDDFFSVDKNPEAELTIKSAKETAAGKYDVTADLKIKGITKPITFQAEVTKQGAAYKALGKLVVDRTKYDIKYNSEILGVKVPVDRIIKDQFELDFELTAKM